MSDPLKPLPGRKASFWPSSQEWDRTYERWHKMSRQLRERHPAIEFELGIASSQHSGTVHLHRCRSKAIGSGAGSAFMRDLVFFADAEGVSLSLLVGDHPDNPTSAEQLRRWYGEFGFRARDEFHMTRAPRSPVTRPIKEQANTLDGEEADEVSKPGPKRMRP